eukprot:10323-Rhodomonas_salina.1
MFQSRRLRSPHWQTPVVPLARSRGSTPGNPDILSPRSRSDTSPTHTHHSPKTRSPPCKSRLSTPRTNLRPAPCTRRCKDSL